MTAEPEPDSDHEGKRINIFKLTRIVNKILRASDDVETFGSGIMNEKLIIAAYETMTIAQLESMRYILKNIIKKKKIIKRIREKEKLEKVGGEVGRST
jgi:hypothetical protein